MEITDRDEIALVMCFRKLIETKKAYIEIKKKRNSNYNKVAATERKCDEIYFDLMEMVDDVRDEVYAD